MKFMLRPEIVSLWNFKAFPDCSTLENMLHGYHGNVSITHLAVSDSTVFQNGYVPPQKG